MQQMRLFRLLEMGVEASVLADCLIAVIGQRLVRRICDKCKIADPLTPQIFEQLDAVIQPDRAKKFWKGAGCEACQYSGYMGRVGIFEVITNTPAIREVLSKIAVRDIAGEEIAAALRNAADADGFTTLKMDGIAKSFKGRTTIEEVLRVAPCRSRTMPRRNPWIKPFKTGEGMFPAPAQAHARRLSRLHRSPASGRKRY